MKPTNPKIHTITKNLENPKTSGLIKGFNLENCLVINLDSFNADFNYNNNYSKNLFNINVDVKNNNLNINIFNNTIVEKPIYLINNLICNLNITISTGNNSQFTVIDHKQNQNNITKIFCEKNSIVDYYLIQNMDNSQIQIQQNFNSKFVAKLLANNYNINQLQLEINLLEPSANTEINILQNTKQESKHSIDLLINHSTINSSSSTLARSIADDQSNANLNGKIIVHKSATKTQANLQSKSLILSKQASITSCPELLIDNNDVICTHGSSIGNLDANALFYMQTRGINLEDATNMLLDAFIQPILQKIRYKEIIDYLEL